MADPTTRLFSETFLLAIQQREEFFNRQRAIAAIRSVLTTTRDKAILVVGQRYAGKTSLLNYTLRLLEEEESFKHLSACVLDASAISSRAALASELWDGLGICLKHTGSRMPEQIPTSFQFHSVSRFTAQVGELLESVGQRRFVVCIDEFDRLFYHGGTEHEHQQIIGLLQYIIEKTHLPLNFFLTVLRPLPVNYGSRFPAEQIALLPLETHEVRTLLTHLLPSQLQLSEAAFAALEQLTGGQIVLLKLLLRELARVSGLHQHALIEPVQLESVAQAASSSQSFAEVLEELYSSTYLSAVEQRILAALSGGPLSANQIDQVADGRSTPRHHLVRQGYLCHVRPDHYDLRIGLMRTWLRHQSEPPSPAHQPPVDIDQIPRQGICIDLATKRVYVDGQSLQTELSRPEYDALLYLARQPGAMVTKEDFAQHVWGEQYFDIDDQRIAQLLKRLREKLGTQRDKLVTVRGRGIRLSEARLINH